MHKFLSFTHIDHIFGDLDQAKNAGKWLVERYKGVHHYHQCSPENPEPGDEIRLFATTTSEYAFQSMMLWYTTDDWKTISERPFIRGALTWDTALWAYVTHWTVELPTQPEGTMLRYKIAACREGADAWIFADNQSPEMADATNFAIWFSSERLPKWAKSAEVYQIFVDRFNPGKGNEWDQTTNLRKPFGGTLPGVVEKLPNIRGMGFDALWLTPIFKSPSHHGYDISDYYQINERFGDVSDFRTLVDKAHDLGIKVIMDLVLNHCSNQHPFFIDAKRDKDSPYHDWFVWRDWPAYECFFNVLTMPKINLCYGSPARAYFLDVAKYWLDFGVDAFRLDYANGPEQDFWVDFRRTCQQAKPTVWTFGEVVAPPDVQKTYANGLNGTLDFLLCQAIRLTFAQKEWGLSQFGTFITTHFDYFPEDFSLPMFIDNHDMNRFLFAAGDDDRLLRIALLILYSLPGSLIIYYGTEAGVSQDKSIHEKGAKGFDEARLAMPEQKSMTNDLTHYFGKLSEMRRKAPVNFAEPWKMEHWNDEEETLILMKPGQKLVLVINRSDEKREISFPTVRGRCFRDPVHDTHYCEKDARMSVWLEPVSARLLSLDESDE